MNTDVHIIAPSNTYTCERERQRERKRKKERGREGRERGREGEGESLRHWYIKAGIKIMRSKKFYIKRTKKQV